MYTIKRWLQKSYDLRWFLNCRRTEILYEICWLFHVCETELTKANASITSCYWKMYGQYGPWSQNVYVNKCIPCCSGRARIPEWGGAHKYFQIKSLDEQKKAVVSDTLNFCAFSSISYYLIPSLLHKKTTKRFCMNPKTGPRLNREAGPPAPRLRQCPDEQI